MQFPPAGLLIGMVFVAEYKNLTINANNVYNGDPCRLEAYFYIEVSTPSILWKILPTRFVTGSSTAMLPSCMVHLPSVWGWVCA